SGGGIISEAPRISGHADVVRRCRAVEEEGLAFIDAAVSAPTWHGRFRVPDGDRHGRTGGVAGEVPHGQRGRVDAGDRVRVCARLACGAGPIVEVPVVARDAEVVRGTARVEGHGGSL